MKPFIKPSAYLLLIILVFTIGICTTNAQSKPLDAFKYEMVYPFPEQAPFSINNLSNFRVKTEGKGVTILYTIHIDKLTQNVKSIMVLLPKDIIPVQKFANPAQINGTPIGCEVMKGEKNSKLKFTPGKRKAFKKTDKQFIIQGQIILINE